MIRENSQVCQKDSYVISKERNLYKIIYTIVNEGQAGGEFIDDIGEEELGKMIIRNMRGTFYEWCLHEEQFDIVSDGILAMSLFVYGITR